MKNNITILAAIVITLLFTGCGNSIKFENYQLKSNIQTKQKAQIPLKLDQIEMSSMISDFDAYDLRKFIEYSDIYNKRFNQFEENKEWEVKLKLTELYHFTTYYPGHEYKVKGQIKWSDGYFRTKVYTTIEWKIINKKDKAAISDIIEIGNYWDRYDNREYSKIELINSTLNEALTKFFATIQREMATPFTIEKVMENKIEKDKELKYIVSLNGGTCDGLYIGEKVSIMDINEVIATGTIAPSSSCKRAWVKINNYKLPPHSGNKVYMIYQ